MDKSGSSRVLVRGSHQRAVGLGSAFAAEVAKSYRATTQHSGHVVTAGVELAGSDGDCLATPDAPGARGWAGQKRWGGDAEEIVRWPEVLDSSAWGSRVR